ncbi:hypothetical protein [Sulfuriroseicoccus oceanibius]|uniref:Outer membrane lipoprotein-sorting protein n=1 Tax=Sulfuriroseicoccus oceanibius TaxID=2707525 RepID=A0A6B3L8F6_9BACT|nr:hypothetical protein [Sulfuriroseicoccus oceanibius]QQL44990.1 hypothetical protein G3M56_014185 [Sulfuriroseicoccus oceanibius]
MKPSLALLCGLLSLAPAFADLTSSQAVNALERQYGAAKFDHIVSLSAERGEPNPREWVVVVFDPESPTTLRSYWADETRVVTRGVNSAFYPGRVPSGFVDAAKIKVNSESAFAIVDDLARQEKVGFNEVTYTLRAIDFTDDPIWVIRLIDVRRQVVGRVTLSAESGKVLRRVWLTPTAARRGMAPFVRDSLAPKEGDGRPLIPVEPGEGLPTREVDGFPIDPVPDDAPLGLPPLPEVDVTAGLVGIERERREREPELPTRDPDPLYQELPDDE